MKKYISIICILAALLCMLTSCSLTETAKDKIDKNHPDTEEATAEPTTEQLLTPDEERPIEDIIADMTLYEKICQMLIVNPETITGVDTVISAGEKTKEALETYPVGGLIYSKPNLQSPDQVKEMIANVQSYSDIELFIAADEEGGIVNRLMDTLGTTYIDSMYTYKDEGADVAYENAKTIGMDMKSFGFNLDFAPVADVWSNPSNTVIAKRAYSDDFEQAAELIPQAIAGFHDSGVMCTIKHFPGHGDTVEDSHKGTAKVTKSVDELENEEFLPFMAGIDAGTDMVMIGHLMVPAIDEEYPASLSYEIVTNTLRYQLDYDGVVITDGMGMQAITDLYGQGPAAVLSIQAGCDIILQPTDVDEVINAIKGAVEDGTLDEKRIDESLYRILSLKRKYGLDITSP